MTNLDRAFNDWYSEPDDGIEIEFAEPAEFASTIELSTLDLINSGILVSDDSVDGELWHSLRNSVIPMTLSAEEWGDVAR